MKASYNVTTDRLAFQPDHRLSDEEYKLVKAARFTWWPGRQVFSAVWNTEAEDLILVMGLEIEANDEPDDLEGRVERFQERAEAAETDAERSTLAVSGLNADGTERTRTMTARRTEITLAHAAKASEEALHWQRRIKGAIRHAARKDDPGVIARRIEKMEADLRGFEREKGFCGKSGILYQLYDAKEAGQDLALLKAAHITWAQRWIDHITMRLEYERAYLAAVGGSPDAGLVFEVGGGVKWRGWFCRIDKINPKTLKVHVLNVVSSWSLTLDKTEIKEVLTKDELGTVGSVV